MVILIEANGGNGRSLMDVGGDGTAGILLTLLYFPPVSSGV
jgi:hypothetical protein